MNQVLREFETITTTRFCSFYSKDFGKHHDRGIRSDGYAFKNCDLLAENQLEELSHNVRSEKSKKHKVYFEGPAAGNTRIQFDGCPFIIVGRKVCDCQHGVERDRHAKEKKRN
ncbi:unnamed protein product [Pocillopora meandrina]|uniref:Uncharacterized protein n=1 Tax=Pocillopora meandrina TaxID=46732 RepID=A0AAU9WHL8_9CNID|nr:unnamed protein product [Pocillopora meandrina]